MKKSIRSREDIHAYVLKQMDDEKDAKERYASARSAEAFGLIPKGFNLDTFLVDLLTEQIAGLYDPKAHEFYIADWIPADEQRMVMAHELTHRTHKISSLISSPGCTPRGQTTMLKWRARLFWKAAPWPACSISS